MEEDYWDSTKGDWSNRFREELAMTLRDLKERVFLLEIACQQLQEEIVALKEHEK